MSKTPTTFYRVYGSLASVCLIPLPAGTGVSQEGDSYFYEYEDIVDGDRHTSRETVYPSKAAAWESVKADIRAEIAERERMLEAVILAWSKDEDRAKAPL
jgi:hypothetical protein